MRTLSKLTVLIIAVSISLSASSQNLNNILEGFSLNKVPTDRPVVGAKWVNGIGATSEGLPRQELMVAKSLNSYSFDQETNKQLKLAIKAILGLEGEAYSDLDIMLNSLEMEGIRNIYNLSLVEGEMVVFEAVKAKSFDIVYNSSLENGIKSKIPASFIVNDIGAGSSDKKRMSLNGENLYVAFKIVKVNKVSSRKKTKKIDRETFTVNGLMDYDITFNTRKLLGYAVKKAKETMPAERFSSLKNFSEIIKTYSVEQPITVSIVSEKRGDMATGIFKKVIDFCYCKSFGDIDGRMFLINTINSGSLISFDYLLIEDFYISYDVLPGVTSPEGMPVGFQTLQKGAKASIISKSYSISNVLK